MSNTSFNDRLLDRLVDGELTPDERREAILAIEGAPDGWRRCALAFLEAQSWRSAMQSFEFAPAPLQQSPPASSTLPGEPQATSPGAVESFWGYVAALAAGLLIAVAFGRGLPRGGTSPTHPGEHDAEGALAQTVRPEAEEPQHPDDMRSSGDALTLLVRGQSGDVQRLELPLLSAEELEPALDAVPNWAQAEPLRQRFKEHGLSLQARRRYAPLFIEQGGDVVPMVVPVDDAYVTPVKHELY
ncbi:MAG: hypothetical protein KDA61_07315 [Planctomycetales bacterium]|nr:hypothetical protein [Planctomycetales bacterium]